MGAKTYYSAPPKTIVLKFVFFRIENDPDKSVRSDRRNIPQIVFGQAIKGALCGSLAESGFAADRCSNDAPQLRSVRILRTSMKVWQFLTFA